MIRSLLIASVSSFVLVSGAFAADLPSVKGPPPYMPPPLPVFTWTGFYVGLNGGYGGNQFVYPFSLGPVLGVVANGSASLTSGGFLGGGQVGFNYQVPASAFVLGLEADADATSIRGQLGFNASVATVPYRQWRSGKPY